MNRFIFTLIGLIVISTSIKSQKNNNNNNNLVHGQFVGFGEFNPNQPNFEVGKGSTNSQPGGSVIFHSTQRPPTLNNDDSVDSVNNNSNNNGLIRGRFPGFSPNKNQGQNNAATTTTTTSSPLQTPTTPSPSYLSCLANCPTTNEYNPVCGNDNQTYQNQWRLNCAQRCGKSVAMTRLGACQSS